MNDNASTVTGRRIPRMILNIILILFVTWLLWLVLILLFQETFIFPRFIANRDTPIAAPDAVEVLRRPLGGEEHVEAWYLPPLNTTEPAPLLVIAHGNGENIDDWFDFAYRQSQRGYAVLLPEYRGYGRSGGSPGQDVLVEDAGGFLASVLDRPEVDADRVGFIGMSIGTGVLSQLALEHEPDAIVMIVPPARIDTFLWRFGAPPLLMRHPFRTDLAVQQMDVPILICSNLQDHIIPKGDGRTLHELAPNSTYLEFRGDHNVLADEAETRRRREAIDSFLDSHLH